MFSWDMTVSKETLKSMGARTITAYILVGMVLFFLFDIRIPQWQRTQYLERSLLANPGENYRNGVLCFDNITKISPLTREAYGDLGACFYRLGQYQEAIRAYEDGLLVEPGYLPYLQNVAYIRQKIKNPQEPGDIFIEPSGQAFCP